MDCRETQELLTAFHDGELQAADHARVEEHLRGCRECGALLADLERADRAAGVPDPGPAYWDRFNARVMDRVTQAADGQGWPSAGAGMDATGFIAPADGQGWPSAGAGRDAPGFRAPNDPKVATLRPKHGWMRQQFRYLIPAAAVAALVVAVVRFEGTPPVSEPRPAERDMAGSKAGPATPKKGESTAVAPPAPQMAVSEDRLAAVAREERERQAYRSLPSGKQAGMPLVSESRPAPAPAERPSAGAAKDATGSVVQAVPSPPMASRDANEGMRLEMQAERKKMAKATSMMAAKEESGTSPCERARILAERERFREAEDAQRACLAGKLPEPAREKGLVFLAELLDRQARFADADAVIAEVDRRFPQSRPLDLYRQQRPLIQKRLE